MARPRCPCGDRSSSMRNTTTKRRSGSASRTCANTSNPFSETSGSHMTNERCPRGTPEEALAWYLLIPPQPCLSFGVTMSHCVEPSHRINSPGTGRLPVSEPVLRGALEQLRRACTGRHRTSHRAAFFGGKTERHQRFERSAPSSCVFHGEQSDGVRHDPWDGTVRACPATRPEVAHDRDTRRRRLRRAAPPGPGFFRQTNARTAWRARPIDGGSYRGDCSRYWRAGSALRAVSVRPGAAGVDTNGFFPEESRGIHRDVPSHQCGSPHSAGAAFAAEQHADFVRRICAGCLCGRVSRKGYNRLGRRPSSHRLRLFVDQNFVKQLMRIADAEI